jgi:nitroreductase
MMMQEISAEIREYRKPDYPILPLILNRWSPRSMSGEGMTDEELMPLFEAARWAPSSYNGQPWRFHYAKRGTPHWHDFFSLMVEGNQSWTKDAAVLVVVVSRTTFEHNEKLSHTHSFDTGAAWMNLALEASARGYVAHGMEGFDYEKAKSVLNLSEHYRVEAMIAIGKRAPLEHLSKELRVREKPSTRRPLREIAIEGPFNKGLEQ